MLVLVTGRVIGWTLHLAICVRRYSYMRRGIAISGGTLGPLLRYGGWTTLTNVVSPMMVFLDRFLIGALLPIAAVTHYVTPYEAITKMTVIPSAILAAMFPAFAATFASDRERMGQLYDRALRAVVIVTFPVLLVAIALAPEGMRLWMGLSLPPVSTTVLQVLAIGIFINSIAQAPFAALQGAGRPDLIAKLHLLELPVYVGAIWLLIHTLGLIGVAIAWTLRVTIDAVALLLVTRGTLKLPLLPERAGVWTIALMLTALGAAAVPSALLIRVVLVLVVGVLFATLAWRHLLTSPERAALVSWRAGGVLGPPSEEPA
jgi:O-antigen/teichoic acid export membrane protein